MVIFHSYVGLPEGNSSRIIHNIPINIQLMWLKQCHKPPMTGNGLNHTYKNGDDWGMVYEIVVLHIKQIGNLVTYWSWKCYIVWIVWKIVEGFLVRLTIPRLPVASQISNHCVFTSWVLGWLVTCLTGNWKMIWLGSLQRDKVTLSCRYIGEHKTTDPILHAVDSFANVAGTILDPCHDLGHMFCLKDSTMWGPQDISWFRFAPVTSSL